MKKTAQSGSDREGETDMTRKEIRKKGFTLMELLAVVAIIGILSALIAVGVIAYNRSLKVMELNNTAEEIYIAAQNHLTALRTNATAKDTLDTIGYGTKASTASSKAPADLEDKSQWDAIYAFGNSSASSGTTAASGGTSGSGSTVASGGTGTAASGNGSSNTSYTQLATYILPAGAVDGTVAGEGNSYIIEYNPKAYTVYGVFYADGKSSVLGRDTGETISVTNDLADLNKDVKADGKTKITSYKPKNGSTGICVGYYGGSGAGSLNSVSLEGSISVKLVNAEKLYAEITTKKLSVSGADTAAQANKNIRLWLTVTGKTSGAIKTYGCTIDTSGDEDKDSIDDAWKEQGKIQKNGSGSDMTITRQVVLDDITTAGCHFAEIFGSGKTDNGLNFIPGEDITVSASAAVTDSLSNIVYSNGTQSTNSLFASLQSSSSGTSAASGASGSTSGGNAAGKITETVTIANFRHLENLSPDVSHVLGMTSGNDTSNAVSLTQSAEKATNKNNKYLSGQYQFAAVLGNDLIGVSTDTKSDSSSRSWQGFLRQIQILNGKDSSAINGEVSVYHCANNQSSGTTTSTQNATCTAVGSFAPVRNDYLSGFDGLNHTIEGVLISSDETSSGARGLFSIVSPVQDCMLKDVTLKNFDITAASTSDGNEVENNNADPRKTNKIIPAGSFAGIIAPQESASVKVSGVTVLEDNSNTCGVWGGGGTEESATVCGGLIGEIYTTNAASVTVEKSTSSVYVQSAKQKAQQLSFSKMDVAGGLIGVISNNEGTVTVKNSYAGGHTDNAQTDPYNAGNKTRGQDGIGWNVTAGNSAGGLIGGIYTAKNPRNKITIQDVYSTASAACVDSSGKAIPESDAGGLIGYISNHTYKTDYLSVSDSYCTGLLKATYMGGIAGYIALAGDLSDTEKLATDKVNTGLVGIFSNCAWLEGVNADDLNCAYVMTQKTENGHTVEHVKSAQDTNNQAMVQKSATELRVATNKEGTATPYDTKNLSTTYDFPLVTGHHYGDWPKITQSNINHNGNRLMIDVDTTSDIVTILLTGLQSGEHEYIVIYNKNNGKLNYQASGNASNVFVAKNLNQIFDYDEDGNVKDLWGNNRQGYDIDSIGTHYRIKITKNDDGSNHYSLMLDNISGDKDNFLAFCQHTNSQFYYGEYLNVRITDKYTKNSDPRYKTNCIADYVINSLFEDVFDPAVLNNQGVLSNDGTVNLESSAVKDSIKKLTFNGGKDLPNDIRSNDFKTVETTNKQYVAIINNARHLENLRSDLSNVNKSNNFTVINAVQGCDIIWDSETAGDTSNSNHEYAAYVDELNETNQERGGSDIYVQEGKHIENRCFLSVGITDDNELTSYNGNGNSIYGLNLAANNMDSGQAGLFSVISGSSKDFQISHLHLVNTKCKAGKGSATLYTFGTVVGESDRNLTLNDVKIEQTNSALDGFQVESQQKCGGMVGFAKGNLQISDCVITASSVSVSGKTEDVGGLVGNASTAIVNITGSSLESPSVTVSNEKGASKPCGGLVASCKGGTIENCHISGENKATENITVNISSGASNSNQTGGLVGLVNGGSFAMTDSWLGADMATVSNLGSTAPAGGLIGEVASTDFKLENSYVCGANARVMSGSSNQGSVGGLIGEIKTNQGNCSISNDYFSGYVYGPNAQNAGGLIGRIEAGGTSTKYSIIQNCYASGRTYHGLFPQDSTDLNQGDADYNRFSMPYKKETLQNKPIDSVIGYTMAGGLIGCHDNGYLQILNSFTSTAVAGVNNGCYAGGLIGFTCGTLQLNNSYAVSTVEAQNQDNSVLGSFIGYNKDAQKTTAQACYIIKELNNDSVQSIGKTDNSGSTSSIAELFVNKLDVLKREVKSPDDTETVERDDSLKNNSYYANGYPYIISTKVNGNNHFDGCWVDLYSGEPTIQLSENNISIATNETYTLTANIVPRWKAATKPTWTSSDETVASVDTNGVVTGKTIGTAYITAKLDDDHKATCTVNVYNVGIQKSENETETDVTGQTINILPTDSMKLSMSGIPDGTKVTWTVDKNSNWFASVDQDGDFKIYNQSASGSTVTVTATADINGAQVTACVYIHIVKLDSTDGNFEEWDFFDQLNVSQTDNRTVKAYYTNDGNLNVYLSAPDASSNIDGYFYLKINDTLCRFKPNENLNGLVVQNNWQGWTDYIAGVKYTDSDGMMQAEFQIPSSRMNGASAIYLQPASSIASGSDTFSYTVAVTLPSK